MIVTDDYGDKVDTREEAVRLGRYCDGLAVILARIVGDGGDDESAGDFTIAGCAQRIGRRVLWVTSAGFLSSARYASEEAAHAALVDAFPEDFRPEPDGYVCTDCAHLIANGEYLEHLNPPALAEWEAAYNAHTAGIIWAIGHADQDHEFSWSSCDACGSGLGGYRHAAYVIERP